MLQDLPNNQGSSRRSRLRYVVPVSLRCRFWRSRPSSCSWPHPIPASASAGPRWPRSHSRAAAARSRASSPSAVASSRSCPYAFDGARSSRSTSCPAGERITIQATIRRPGWISWLTGKNEQVKVSETTPVAKLASSFLTRKRGQPVTVDFDDAVAEAGFGGLGANVAAKRLAAPSTSLALNEQATAGTGDVAVAARTWEVPTVTDDLVVPSRHQGDGCRNAGARHQDHARHEDHPDLLEARREGAGQKSAAGDPAQGRCLARSSTRTRSSSCPRATATASVPMYGSRCRRASISWAARLAAPIRSANGPSRTDRRSRCSSCWLSSGTCR